MVPCTTPGGRRPTAPDRPPATTFKIREAPAPLSGTDGSSLAPCHSTGHRPWPEGQVTPPPFHRRSRHSHWPGQETPPAPGSPPPELQMSPGGSRGPSAAHLRRLGRG
ncbi:hypothetical protein NDU88_002880 [Pleurodeles waltl]|uniref:Uncharacterized protein n=1 Tax=Pleurodeles waltl TaxID=8319 RepID=A0AAV7V038_PLEWA|nr:hypothetical protein NDU88_002880 [Pleurodeles waltl]